MVSCIHVFVHARALRQQLIAAGLVLLVACNNNYQAPVSEQGAPQVVQPPLILSGDAPASQSRGNPTPVATAARAPAASRPLGQARTHTVRRGETLYSIAFQYDLDFRALALANNLNPPYTIFVDQELKLEVGQGAPASSSSVIGNLGTPVANNSVARAQGTATGSGGLIRQPIGANTEPSWQWPLSGQIIRGFENGQNKGIDIGARLGDPVYAASDGDVVYSGRGIQGAGELIILRHSDRYLSAYAYNSAMRVKEGDRVRAGQQIAEVGASSAGDPALHFEIRVDGKSVDPTGLLPRR
jgi:lipoprotein NlpD